jgi:hypothetical protein
LSGISIYCVQHKNFHHSAMRNSSRKPKRYPPKQRTRRLVEPGDNPKDVLVHTARPPTIHPQLVYHQRMRFQCLVAGSQIVTFADLLDLYLVATSATAVYDVFDAVRVNFVEIWAASVSFGAPLSIYLEFNGANTAGLTGNAKAYSDTVMSTEPAHLLCKPGKDTASGMWNESSANAAWSMTVPVNTIIDVDCSFRNLISPPQLAQVVAVGATTGQFYYRGLDGVAVSTTKFTPVVTFGNSI